LSDKKADIRELEDTFDSIYASVNRIVRELKTITDSIQRTELATKSMHGIPALLTAMLNELQTQIETKRRETKGKK